MQIGSKIYAIGGFTAQGGTGTFFPLTRRVHVYDMATRSWSELAPLPVAGRRQPLRRRHRRHEHLRRRRPDRATPTATAPTPSGSTTSRPTRGRSSSACPQIRFGGAAFIDNGLLHFVGGDKADRETVDHRPLGHRPRPTPPPAGSPRAPIPLAGDHMSHATINGKVYLFGGEHGHHGLDGPTTTTATSSTTTPSSTTPPTTPGPARPTCRWPSRTSKAPRSSSTARPS